MSVHSETRERSGALRWNLKGQRTGSARPSKMKTRAEKRARFSLLAFQRFREALPLREGNGRQSQAGADPGAGLGNRDQVDRLRII